MTQREKLKVLRRLRFNNWFYNKLFNKGGNLGLCSMLNVSIIRDLPELYQQRTHQNPVSTLYWHPTPGKRFYEERRDAINKAIKKVKENF